MPRSNTSCRVSLSSQALSISTGFLSGFALSSSNANGFTRGAGGLDISGAWGAGGQTTPYLVPHVKDRCSDQMHFVEETGHMRGAGNRPKLAGEDVNPHHYVESVVQGFTDMYLLLVHLREEFCAPRGPLAAFSQAEIRFIPRSTRIYTKLLDASFHPNVLRSGIDRDLLLDRIWMGGHEKPALQRLIVGEHSDLENGDIPIIRTKPASKNVWTSSGKVIRNLLNRSGMETAKRRFNVMDDVNLRRQISVIRCSLANVETTHSSKVSRVSSPRTQPASQASREQLIDSALMIASQIERTAYVDRNYITWMSHVSSTHDKWTVLPATIDLYDGLPGIACFVAYLADVTKCERYRVLAEQIVQTALACLKAVQGPYGSYTQNVGAFTGNGGLIYLLCHLSRLWADHNLLNRAEDIATACEPYIERCEEFDWLSGIAG